MSKMSKGSHTSMVVQVFVAAMLIWCLPISAAVLKHAAGHWPPYSLTNEKPYSGIDLDLVSELSKRTGLTTELKRCSFKRCLAEGEAGGVDIVTGIAHTEERARYLEYMSLPYSMVEVTFYVRKGDANLIQSYQDLYQHKVGRVVKSHYFEPFNSDEKIDSYEASEESILLLMLANNRLDVIIGTNPNLSYEALKLGLNDKFEPASYSPNHKVPVYLAFSKKSPHLAELLKFEQALGTMLEDGTLTDIHARYK